MGGFGSVFPFFNIILNIRLLSKLVPLAQAVGTMPVAVVVVSAGAHRAQGIHIDFWGDFLSKNYSIQISILGSNE